MLRVLFSELDIRPWVLSEDDFLSRIDGLAETKLADVPPGRVSVEAVDRFERILWRSYYPNTAALAILARQIRDGSEVVTQRRAREPA